MLNCVCDIKIYLDFLNIYTNFAYCIRIYIVTHYFVLTFLIKNIF